MSRFWAFMRESAFGNILMLIAILAFIMLILIALRESPSDSQIGTQTTSTETADEGTTGFDAQALQSQDDPPRTWLVITPIYLTREPLDATLPTVTPARNP